MGKNKRKRSHTKHVFVQKKYRDALFRRIFNEKSVLMELYLSLIHIFPDSAAQNTSSPISTRPCLECTARVYNINYGHNQELMARCRTLEDYSILIGRISSSVRNGIPLEQAADAAVQELSLIHI